ncbi:hypothetical protein ACFSM7_07225 [Clavibacter michiganensis subsp. tessellarius]
MRDPPRRAAHASPRTPRPTRAIRVAATWTARGIRRPPGAARSRKKDPSP